MASRETIDKIVKGERLYQTAEEMSVIMNEYFRSAFIVDVDFIEPNEEVWQEGYRKSWCKNMKLANC